MKRRARIAGPRRFAVASAFVAAGLLLIVASQQSRAASAPPSACPDGFHWERMSGVGCVQTTLPPHGQYTDTSAAICSEPYIAEHAPGPNLYGTDPNANYLVACLTAQVPSAPLRRSMSLSMLLIWRLFSSSCPSPCLRAGAARLPSKGI